MKTLLTLSVALIAFAAAPAFADKHDDKKPSHALKADTDGDGVISKAEFLKKHEERFDTLDTDGNGEISAEEREAVRAKAPEQTKEMKEERKKRMEERKAKREADQK